MDRLPPETPVNPEINEATPLLHDEACAIDPELYAIGGAAGFADEPINEPQTDINKLIEKLYLTCLQFSPSNLDRPEHEDSESVAPRALHAMSTALRQITAERDVLPESEVIIQGLTEFMAYYTNQSQPMTRDSIKHAIEEAFSAHVTEISVEDWQQILEGNEEEDAQEMSQPIKSAQSQPMIPDSVKHAIEEAFSVHVTEITAEGLQQILDGNEEEDAQEKVRKKTDFDNIIDALFLAWLQFPPRRSDRPGREDSKFLGPRALHAMSTAWRKIKTEIDVLPESEVIVQGLTKSMVEYMYRLQMMIPDDEEHIIEEASTEYVTKIVAEGWQQILNRIEKEDARERAREKRERRRRNRERYERRREIAEVLFFYEPFARINHHVPLDCRIFCINLCLCWSVFLFQVLITTLLLPWTLSIGIMGGLYMKQCPMSYLMPYVMMAIGVVGTIALLIRLSFAIYERISGDQMNEMCLWILLKFTEFAFLDFIIVYLYYFYSKTPSFVLGSPDYCNETFYNFVHWINYVSIAVASTWLLVYFIKGILTYQLRKYSLRPW